MPDITITLTDDERDDVADTVGDAEAWLRSNVAHLVAQCRAAQRERRARGVGLPDLVGLGLTEEESLRVIGPREDALAEKKAAEAAKKAAREVEKPSVAPGFGS